MNSVDGCLRLIDIENNRAVLSIKPVTASLPGPSKMVATRSLINTMGVVRLHHTGAVRMNIAASRAQDDEIAQLIKLVMQGR